MTYCDTSFLLALYIRTDAFHAQATKISARWTESIPYTLLTELELINGVRRSLAAKIIDQREHDAIFRQIAEDEFEAILVRFSVPQVEHYAKARDLSKKFTPETSARSLDILQVAAAFQIKATEFASFDEKQRVFAKKAGLKLIPEIIIRKKAK